MSAAAIEKPDSVQVEMRHGDSWLRLSAHLGELFTGGWVVRLMPEATFAMEGIDPLSRSNGQANWLSGAASGIFYAYRTLKATRRVVYLTTFTGRLRSTDMDAVATAGAWAVAACLHAALPVELGDWEIKILSPDTSENGKQPAASIASSHPE